MSKTLDKVVKTMPKLGLAGLLAMSSGCLGAAIISGYGAQCNQPGAYAFGNALNQTEAAREGRSETVVAVQQPREGNSNNAQDNGFRNGTLRWPNGQVYTGDILDNNAHGRGTMIYGTGEKYNGQFRNGHREGYGVLEFNEGSRYEGNFHNDKREGYGKFTFKTGEIQEGYWKDEDFVGKEKPKE